MNERCEKHNLTRCTTCMALEHHKPQAAVPVAPPEIAGGPPPDIEDVHGTGSVRDRIDPDPPTDVNKMNVDALRAEVAECAAIKAGCFSEEAPFELSSKRELATPGPGVSTINGVAFPTAEKESFDALPVDDSHASKVVRAAAAYADASRIWAQELARTEKIKQSLLRAEADLQAAQTKKETAERELKTLVTGEAA